LIRFLYWQLIGLLMITKTILMLGVIVGFVIGISFSSVYAGIPWSTNEIADDAITSEKIKNKQVKGKDLRGNSVNSGKIKDGTITAADIGTNAVRSSEIVANAVGGSEIAGTKKLIFGSCSLNFGSVGPSGTRIITCPELSASLGDRIVASIDDPSNEFCLSLVNVETQNNVVGLIFRNILDQTCGPFNLTISYIIFKIPLGPIG